jgi:DNA-binding Lrp family transcriptional regulator
MKLRSIDYKLLFELIKNCRRSDRKLAKAVGVSQPTVSKSREKLERERMLEYMAIPNFDKLGIHIIALIFLSVKSEERKPKSLTSVHKEWKKKSDEFFSKYPNIIFAATGRGMEKNTVCISVHRDYSSLAALLRDVEIEWGKYLEKVEPFIVSVKSDRIRRFFAFRSLADYLKNT